MALEQELEVYRNRLPDLLRSDRGKFVLIHGGRVDSIWETLDRALQEGYNRFGIAPFLVKEITEQEQEQYFSRNVARCR